MSPTGIQTALADAGVPGTATGLFDDDDYRLPSEKWLRDQFIFAWLKLAAALGLFFQKQALDCDNFSSFCRDYAQLLHANTPGHGETGLAFGTFCYHPAAMDGYHEVCFAVVAEDAFKAKVIWLEPQPVNCHLYIPSRQEISTCTDYRI